MGAKAKALTRKITRKQARSYEKSYPNARGVTHISEVNGPGAYARRYAKTRDFLSNAEMPMYTRKQQAAMKRMSPARRAAFKKMLNRAPKLGGRKMRKNRATPTASEQRAYGEGYERIFGKKKRSKKKTTKKRTTKKAAPKRRTTARRAAPKRKTARRAAPKRKTTARKAAPKKRMTKAQFFAKHEGKLGAKRTKALWKAIQTKRGVAGKSRKQTRTYAGKYKALRASIGPKKRWTYKYRTKRGRVGDIPDFALMGYPSARAMHQVTRTGSEAERARLARKMQRLMDRREKEAQRSARRIRQGLGVFSPNAGDEILSFEEWKEMRPNASRKQIAAARRNIKKAQAALRKKRRGGKKTTKRKTSKRKATRRKSTGWTKAKRSAAAKKAARTRKRNAGKKTARKTTKRRVTRKASTKRRKSTSRRGKKLSAATRKRISAALKRYHKSCATPKRRGGKKRRSYKRNQGSYSVNRRRRHYRRNVAGAAYMMELKNALKLGALVTVGYIAHRALTKVVDDYGLAKVESLNTGNVAKYRGLIASAISGLVGVFGTLRIAPASAVPVVAGVAASFIHGAILTALAEANQSKVAAYLSGYPNAKGRAYGSYFTFKPHEVYAGYGRHGVGSYYELPPMSGFGANVMQAAAGYGQPMLAQAAAGYGQVMQAAAGTGEYVAYAANGIGEYEEVPTRAMGMMVDEGIHPNLNSAEQALTVSEAAAGLGDNAVALQSTVNPTMIADPIGDLPGGSRAGVFQGGDGIFG